MFFKTYNFFLLILGYRSNQEGRRKYSNLFFKILFYYFVGVTNMYTCQIIALQYSLCAKLRKNEWTWRNYKVDFRTQQNLGFDSFKAIVTCFVFALVSLHHISEEVSRSATSAATINRKYKVPQCDM